VEGFVGRLREQEVVERAIAAADGTRRGLVWITGPAGIGKSAFAAHLAGLHEPVAVFRGVADHVRLRPFGALVDAFGTTVLPQVHAPLGAAVHVPAALQVGEAVSAILADQASRSTAAGGSIVVVLDDLHRADDDTIDAVELIASELRDQPVIVLATARPPVSGSRLDLAVHGDATTVHLRLGGLERDDLRELLRDAGVAEADLDAPLASTDGNPLLALAIAASSRTDASRSVERPGLDVFVRRALAELGEPDAEVARAVSLIGEATSLDEVSAVADLDPIATARALDRAVVVGLCTADGPIRPRHDLVATEIIAAIPPAHRALMHRRAAEHLRSVGGAPHRLVAHAIASGARDAGWVVDVVERTVGAEPAAALAMVEALRPTISDVGSRRRLDVVRARALAATGRAADATAAASALLEVESEPQVRAALHRELALVAIVEARPADAAEQMSAALLLLDDPVARARAQAELAVAFLVTRDIPSAGRLAAAALAEAEAVHDPVSLTAAVEVLLFVHACHGDVPAMRAARRRLSALLTLSGVEPAWIYQPWLLSALADLDLGDSGVAAATAGDGRAAADRTGMTWAIAAYDAVSATAAWFDGSFADAATMGRAALEGATISDPFLVGPWAAGVAALASIELGDHAAAEAAVAHGAELVAASGPTLGSERWAIAAARVSSRAGRLDDARKVLEDWWLLYDALPSRIGQAHLAGDLAALAVAMGDRDRAAEVAETVRGHLDVPVALLAALAAEARCWAQPEPITLMAAADAWSAAPRGLAVAGLGRLSTIGIEDRSVRLVQQRRDVLRRQLGLDDASMASAASRQAVSGIDALTRTERDVAMLVAQGCSNRDIADRLVVSRRTVESHMGAIYRKLAVTTRVQVANTMRSSTS
jgi:DNA-binding CsgD family transcriptional regulator